MKLQHYLLLSVLLHLIPVVNSSFWVKASAVEIIEAAFISGVHGQKNSAQQSVSLLSAKSSARNLTPTISAHSESIPALGIVSESSGTSGPSVSSTTMPPRVLKEVLAPYPKNSVPGNFIGVNPNFIF